MTILGWEPRLTTLVTALTGEGHLRSKEWIDAFAATPRHLFTPDVFVTSANGYRRLSGDDPADRDEWLSLVYSDESLVTQDKPHAAGHILPTGEPLRVPTSSSTMPSLMARMLEALDVRDGMKILEIGTGTGYNAALLSHRVGDRNVISADIDPALVHHATKRLTDLGYTPTLIIGDGAAGAPEHGPYDRIITTAAIPEVPSAWIQQLKPGGKILGNLRGDLAGGTLCLLTHDNDGEVIGPILPIGGHFMWLRPDPADPHHPHEHTPTQRRWPSSRTTTPLSPADLPVDDEAFRFLLQLQLHGAQSLYRGRAFDPSTRRERDAVIATAHDGSRAEAFTEPEPEGAYQIVQSGPRRIFDTIEITRHLFNDLGRPGPDKFGVVANDSTQFVWFANDDGWYRWPLPLI
ncbi:methyltransferase domain-containing protein [Amycolatopsis minnesotensis]|uniref:Protein-L-isoaspartate O-methyltransferase n=1 Tax=Amycolatopsis minnesotensis TaxID=337894 RepID=A0ABN2QY95_9PSEU